MTEETAPVQVWLVERMFAEDKSNLIVLVYATTDGERYTMKEHAISLLEKWTAVFSRGENCNRCVSSSRKFMTRDLADYSVCANVWCPPVWVLLSAVPVFWLWLTELYHVLD